MKNSLKLSIHLDAEPEKVFKAWLSSQEHSNFTGARAQIEPKVGGKLTAWDGYISGKTIEIKKSQSLPWRIVQLWRTTEFPPNAPDSKLEILFEKEKTVTKLTLVHTEIPEGQTKMYKEGWEDYYFAPMTKYFQKNHTHAL